MRNLPKKIISVLLILSSYSAITSQKLPVEYVRPNLGSYHARWFFYTPACVPFGLAKLAPHTNAYGSIGSWLPCGYSDSHSSIEGFGHFHEFQIGGLVTMPSIGKLQTMPSTDEKPDEGYRSRFDKKDEHAEPGFYSVLLKDTGIKAELTATTRVGYHRYTFPKSDDAHIIFDIGHKQGESGDVIDAYIKWDGKTNIEGYIYTYPEYAKFCDPGQYVKMYFYGKLSKTPISSGSFVDSVITPGPKMSKGTHNGMYLQFKTKDKDVIEMQMGLSYTSIENAKNNLLTETKGQIFDNVKAAAKSKWNEKLNRIKVTGTNENDKIKFYTGLYHVLLGRGLANDVNGHYALPGGKTGKLPLDIKGKPTRNHYNSDGMWGGCWNLGPLWALAYPDYFSDYMQSNLDFSDHSGWLHDGVAAGVYTNGVQTNFMGLMLASVYHCGIRDFDINKAYEAARKTELVYEGRNLGNGKYDLEYFIKRGYIPNYDYKLSNGWVFVFGASHTLEYSFTSYAVGQFAKSLGKNEDYKKLNKMAEGYKMLYDPETKFMRPRDTTGAFIKDFDEMKAWVGFQEGNAFQYTWYAPHDVKGLTGLMGRDYFNKRLENMFTESQKSGFGGGKEIHSFSGIEKLYNHGNQPCLFNSWLFNYAGQPWQSQKWTRAICNEFYGLEAIDGYGYGQDEDQGQMGAWFALTSMGLFDVQGHAAARPTYQIGSPLFDKIEIDLHPKYFGKNKVTIETINNSPSNIYVQSATLNGKKLDNCWFYRDELMKGGKLVLIMGEKPNTSWGVDVPPPSMSDEK